MMSHLDGIPTAATASANIDSFVECRIYFDPSSVVDNSASCPPISSIQIPTTQSRDQDKHHQHSSSTGEVDYTVRYLVGQCVGLQCFLDEALSFYRWNFDPLILEPVLTLSATKPTTVSTTNLRSNSNSSNGHRFHDFCSSSVSSGRAYVAGLVRIGDSVEDAWNVVKLMAMLTKRFPDLSIQIFDEDERDYEDDADGENWESSFWSLLSQGGKKKNGESTKIDRNETLISGRTRRGISCNMLLTEAAWSLPSWLNPEIASNRVFIRQGNVAVISPIVKPIRQLSLEEGLKAIRGELLGERVEVYRRIQKAIRRKLRSPDLIGPVQGKRATQQNTDSAEIGNPHKTEKELTNGQSYHICRCYLPRSVALLIVKYPQLVSIAINHLPPPQQALKRPTKRIVQSADQLTPSSVTDKATSLETGPQLEQIIHTLSSVLPPTTAESLQFDCTGLSQADMVVMGVPFPLCQFARFQRLTSFRRPVNFTSRKWLCPCPTLSTVHCYASGSTSVSDVVLMDRGSKLCLGLYTAYLDNCRSDSTAFISHPHCRGVLRSQTNHSKKPCPSSELPVFPHAQSTFDSVVNCIRETRLPVGNQYESSCGVAVTDGVPGATSENTDVASTSPVPLRLFASLCQDGWIKHWAATREPCSMAGEVVNGSCVESYGNLHVSHIRSGGGEHNATPVEDINNSSHSSPTNFSTLGCQLLENLVSCDALGLLRSAVWCDLLVSSAIGKMLGRRSMDGLQADRHVEFSQLLCHVYQEATKASRQHAIAREVTPTQSSVELKAPLICEIDNPPVVPLVVSQAENQVSTLAEEGGEGKAAVYRYLGLPKAAWYEELLSVTRDDDDKWCNLEDMSMVEELCSGPQRNLTRTDTLIGKSSKQIPNKLMGLSRDVGGREEGKGEVSSLSSLLENVLNAKSSLEGFEAPSLQHSKTGKSDKVKPCEKTLQDAAREGQLLQQESSGESEAMSEEEGESDDDDDNDDESDESGSDRDPMMEEMFRQLQKELGQAHCIASSYAPPSARQGKGQQMGEENKREDNGNMSMNMNVVYGLQASLEEQKKTLDIGPAELLLNHVGISHKSLQKR
eukprot:GHVQ01034196.1.p1 GENE.GHVQ01034196.1~~GHVQ01034196.1.p1  ORF type:complete len:1081 (+),score=188.27 GHVQ01034196.1:134-3376(+)